MIDLRTPLSLKTAFRFPLQSRDSIRDLLWGALLLVLLPGLGWILNMGHRIQMVHQMQNGEPAWPAWHHYGRLLKLGFITWLGMVFYYAPGAVFIALGVRHASDALLKLGTLLILLATLAIPGYMSHYCVRYDPSEIYNPFKALRRCIDGGKNYWLAWGIALTSLALSFIGLIVFGVGFLISSVWFWQVAGYSFAAVFTNRYHLMKSDR